MNPLLFALPLLSALEARTQGYTSITVPVTISSEQEIIKSMEQSMKGIDAVWVVLGRTQLELARKKTDLKLGSDENYSKAAPATNH